MALEGYIEEFSKSGKAEPGQIEQVRNLLAIEQKKIEKAFNKERELSEESKTEENTARDQESRNGDSESEKSSSSESDEQTNDDASLLMAAPNTGGELADLVLGLEIQFSLRTLLFLMIMNKTMIEELMNKSSKNSKKKKSTLPSFQ